MTEPGRGYGERPQFDVQIQQGGSGPHGVSALSSVYLVRPGDDVVLPCNVTFNLHTLWFRQQSEDMIHLTTTARDNLNNRTIDEFHIDDNDRLSLYLDNHTKSISLKIIRVKESDQGLYYCTEWETGAIHFGKGVHLAFSGSSSVQTGWKVLGMFLATLPFITATAAAVWARSGGGAMGIS
ncbi:hypothetical protein JZ751_010680, partial [Albula glossodonta]